MVVMEIKSSLHKSLWREKKHNLIKGLDAVVVLTCVSHNISTFLQDAKSLNLKLK